MAFKMKGYSYPGKSPIKDMKTGSYKHSFEDKSSSSPLYEKLPNSPLYEKSPLEQGNMTTCPWPGCGEEIQEAKLQQHLEDHIDAQSNDYEEEIIIEAEDQGGGEVGGDQRVPLQQHVDSEGDKEIMKTEKFPLQDGEHPDTYVYDGDDINEKIIDLEDRIEFVNEDIFNQDGNSTTEQEEALEALQQQLVMLEELNPE